MEKNSQQMIFAGFLVLLSILNIIFFTTTAIVSYYFNSDNFWRYFFNGNVKWRIGGTLLVTHDDNFPSAFAIITLIGLVVIILGSLYWFGLVLTNRKKCLLTNNSLPGPFIGVLLGFGGLLGFIGNMTFIPFGNDLTEATDLSYGFGYISVTVILGLFLLAGIFILLTLKKSKKSTMKKRR